MGMPGSPSKAQAKQESLSFFSRLTQADAPEYNDQTASPGVKKKSKRKQKERVSEQFNDEMKEELEQRVEAY